MLELKSLTTTSPITTDHGLEDRVVAQLQAENEDLQIQREFTALESYVDKFDGMMMMSQVLNSIPTLSVEAAALTEVASAILARGTDLGGVDDFVPGLEAHVIAGLEDEGKGNGFAEKAKKVGAAILEKLKALWAKLIASFNSTGEKIPKLKEKAIELKEQVKDTDQKYKTDLFVYEYNMLVDPISNEIHQYIKQGTISNVDDLLNAPEEKRADVFAAIVDEYLKVLDPISDVNSDGIIELIALDGPTILTLQAPIVTDGKITQFTKVMNRQVSEADLEKEYTLSHDQITAGLIKIIDGLDALAPWIKDIEQINEKVIKSLERTDGSNTESEMTSIKEFMEISKLHNFTYSRVPMRIVRALESTLTNLHGVLKD